MGNFAARRYTGYLQMFSGSNIKKKPQILYITYSYNSFQTLHQIKGIYIKAAEQYA